MRSKTARNTSITLGIRDAMSLARAACQASSRAGRVPVPDELRRLSKAATPGPWATYAGHVYSPGPEGANVCSVSEPRASRTVGYLEPEVGSEDIEEAFGNAALIVAAVNDLRSRIAEEDEGRS